MIGARRTFWFVVVTLGGLSCVAGRSQSVDPVVPGKTWARLEASKAGLDADRLAAFGRFVGGRGCVVRYGYIVHSWGDITRRADVASACKPFYSHLLLKALEEERIAGLDENVVRWEPRLGQLNQALGFKDRGITWRHLANQTSAYQLTDRPGSAYAYNDWQMAMFWDTLFLRVYDVTYASVDATVFHPLLTEPLRCEDNPTLMAFGTGDRPGRVGISVRDFARFGLLYLNRGTWDGKPLLRRDLAEMAVTNPLPNTIPRATGAAAEMIPGQRSIGSRNIPDNQTDHFGSYSWLWWVNGVDRHGTRFWPDAPEDTFGAFGHGGPRAMWVLPDQHIVVSYNDANLNGWTSGADSPTNQAMKRLLAALSD